MTGKLESAGVILIYGCDEQAIEAGNLLKGQLDITALAETLTFAWAGTSNGSSAKFTGIGLALDADTIVATFQLVIDSQVSSASA